MVYIISHFPLIQYINWKGIANDKIKAFEKKACCQFYDAHSKVDFTMACFKSMSPDHFQSQCCVVHTWFTQALS